MILNLVWGNRPRENLLWVVFLYIHIIGIGTAESHWAGKDSG
jgi:hypothetical protein